MHRISARVCLAFVALFVVAGSARADLVRLKSGGEIRGQVDRKTSGPSGSEVTIESLTGAVVVIERANVRFVSRRPAIIEDYETIARKAVDTVDSQWDTAEWCRKNALRTQRESHLQRVVELDPNHEAAHAALGHIKHDGQWMTREEMMTSQGYVRHKGKYITPQELELIEKSKAELESEKEWFHKVRLWYGWLNGDNDTRRLQAANEFKAITDPTAVPALSRAFRTEENNAIRSLYVGILRNIPGKGAVTALVNQSLIDDNPEIRWQSLNGVGENDYGIARPIYIRELKNKANNIVCRAGQSLERVGDDSSVPSLIQALTTVHTYEIPVPEKKGGVSFSTNGQFSLGGALSGPMVLTPEIQALLASGQINPNQVMQSTGPPDRVRIVTIRHEHQNMEVLTALQRITGESFGYDKRSWSLWWNAKKGSTGKGS